MTSYNVHISKREPFEGFFVATCPEAGAETASRDPEHAMCHLLTKAGYNDGPVQFWRDGMPTLSHSSIHKMGRMRIELGIKFPYARVKREEGRPEFFKNPAGRGAQDGQEE